MKFISEIKRVIARKTVSLDVEYEVTFRTEDPSVLVLGSYPADELVIVEVKKEGE